MMFELKLSQARAAYAAKLGEKLARLEALLAQARRGEPGLAEQAQRQAHTICGGAGTFGIDAVAEAAGQIDQQLLEHLAGRAAADAAFWDAIAAALARAQAGLAAETEQAGAERAVPQA